MLQKHIHKYLWDSTLYAGNGRVFKSVEILCLLRKWDIAMVMVWLHTAKVNLLWFY